MSAVEGIELERLNGGGGGGGGLFVRCSPKIRQKEKRQDTHSVVELERANKQGARCWDRSSFVISHVIVF